MVLDSGAMTLALCMHQGMSDTSGHRIEYNDENGKMCEIKVTYAELEREIDRLILEDKYIERE